ncbi:DMT family transporter [Aestuariibius sp. 2305UL40-4]|uniref:DMT family transporter n=1 Tax=Aestuariibius violaceus TaxID=3234132 RepID=UPI0034733810
MSERARGHLAMLLFSMLVAGSFSLGASAANEIAPPVLNLVRFLIAAAILGTLAVVLVPRVRWRQARQAPWRYFVLGGLFSIYFVLMFEGLKTAPPVSAAAVFTLTPVLAGGFGYLVLRQRMTARMALALAIGAAGAIWVIFRADLVAILAFQVGRGEAIYFVGCAAHALYTPMVAKLNRGEPPLLFTFGMLMAGAVILGVVGTPAVAATQWGALPPIVWVTILYTAVFASAATFVLLQYATLRLPSAKVMAYTYLVPAWVIGWELVRSGAGAPWAVASGVAATLLALGLLLKDEAPVERAA